MKAILTSLLIGLGISAMAQQSPSTSSTRTSISDDDRTLSIQVEGTINGKEISYNRQFRVAGMSSAEKAVLKNRVFDSLGVGSVPQPPMLPAPPKPPTMSESGQRTDMGEETVTFVCPTCTGKVRLEVSGSNFSLTRDATLKDDGSKVFPLTVAMASGEYRYQYWQNGVLQMQLPFTVKAGEKNEVSVK